MYKWDEMSARERDALVATKILEIPSDQLEWHEETNCFLWHKPENVLDYGDSQEAFGVVFSPTKEIDDAWRVVEKFTKNGRNLKLMGVNRENEWYVSIDFNARTGTFAPTAPEAICLAALKACGVEIDP